MNDTPTPRTDAIAHSGHNESVYIARMTYLARELERELTAWETEISKVMPPDYKDWWHNDKREWPLVARLVIEGKNRHAELDAAAYDKLERELADARAALMLAAQWGILSDGFSAEVSGAIRCWIINGMKGPPPEAPDYYPKAVNYCYDNLEGPGPTEQERRENARAIQAMTVPERIALLFGKLSQP